MKSVFLSTLLLLTIIAPFITAKAVTDSDSLSHFRKHPWKQMMKFAIAIGTGEYNGRFQFTRPLSTDAKAIEVNMLVYLDEKWDYARSLNTCEEKAAEAHISFPFQVPTDGSWSQDVFHSLSQDIRTHVWYFVVSDCQNNIGKYLDTASSNGSRLKWDLQIRNANGSHFSDEESGLILPLLAFIIVIAALFVSDVMKSFKFYRVEESIDYPTLGVTIGLFIELLSLICEVIHLWIYSVNGRGSFVFDFANQTLSVTSQFIITSLLLLMASGWSINFMKFKDMDVILPIGGVIAFVMLLIVGIGKLVDEEQYFFHDYENWTGMLFMLVRVGLYALWVYLFQQTYKTAINDSERIFFNQMGLLSTIYFLAVPAVVVFATAVVAPYCRHRVVTIGTILMQTLVLVVLTLLFTTKSNRYYQISMKGRAMLPSAKAE